MVRKTKKNKTKAQYVLDPTTRKQTQITKMRHDPSYKTLEVKTSQTSLLCGNRNGHSNTVLGTVKHIIGQRKKQQNEQHGPHLNTGDELRCARMGKQFLLFTRHTLCYSYIY